MGTRCQPLGRSLVVMAVSGQPAGIKQEVYLPVQRTLAYKGSFFARHLSGPSKLTISLAQAEQQRSACLGDDRRKCGRVERVRLSAAAARRRAAAPGASRFRCRA